MARFLQMSDLHVVAKGESASGVLDTRALLRIAIDRLLQMRTALDPLDALLVSGDISDDGSEDSYSFARAQLERLELPFYIVPGNHDAREPFRTAFSDLAHIPDSGLIDWEATITDTCVVGLDTLVEGQGGGRLRAKSLDLLQQAILRSASNPLVVMLHHPPIRTGIRFMDSIGLEDIVPLRSILDSASGEVTVLAGHVHGAHYGKLGRHRVITSPSVCSFFALDRRADAPIGFMRNPSGCAVIDTAPDGLWSEVPLDQADGPYPF